MLRAANRNGDRRLVGFTVVLFAPRWSVEGDFDRPGPAGHVIFLPCMPRRRHGLQLEVLIVNILGTDQAGP